MSTLKVVAAWVGGTIVVAGVCFGGYEGYWVLAGHNADHASHVIRQSYGNQQTLRDRLTADLSTFTNVNVQVQKNPSPALKAQRLAILNMVCNDAEGITGDPLPSDQAQFVSVNCLLGQANPSSLYVQTGN